MAFLAAHSPLAASLLLRRCSGSGAKEEPVVWEGPWPQDGDQGEAGGDFQVMGGFMVTLLLLIAWVLTILALGVSGALESTWNGVPLGPALALVIPLSLYLVDWYWLKSRFFRGLWALDDKTAIMVQAYRIVGVFFLVESLQGRLPLAFALPAGLGDILVGLLAPWVAWRLGEEKPYATTIAVAWNFLGTMDLVCAISLGILHAPTSLGVLGNDLTTRAVTQYPLCLIPSWVVPISLMLHWRSLQGLRKGLPQARNRTVASVVGLAALLLVVIAVGQSVATVRLRGELPRAPVTLTEEMKPKMNMYRFEVERFDYPSSKRTFEQVIAAFEQKVPAADLAQFAQLVASKAPATEIETAVEAMVGDLGFLHLAKLDQGPLVSLLGKRKRMTVYLLGNPVLANTMFEHRPEIGLYAPLRASIYEDDRGVTHFTYDRPSTLLQQFQNNDVTSVAQLLDDRMSKLAEYVTGKE